MVEHTRPANRLASSTSPYLLQHAHNPVDWYPWSDEAIDHAKAEDKPIFLSVGYSTCYWCHVMEREVFENEDIAAIMNEHFINIKVDREQRPDLDEIYMTATQLMTQHGGWPNSVFLTHALGPFYAGTYFGPVDQHGRPGFPTLLHAIANAWKQQREAMLQSADHAAEAIRRVLGERNVPIDPGLLDHSVVDNAVAQLARRYDQTWGGFGGAPKFPNDFTFSLLFDVHHRTADLKTLNLALHSLRMMAAGGLYDHVGGGFHRYSVDARWHVPHFEKMLYNQSQLTRAYVHAFAITGDQSFADVARGTLRYVAELMTGPSGELYSALDAETDAVEGAFYVWTREEITAILADDDFALFDRAFSLAEVPIFPGHKHPVGGVLHMRRPINELASAESMTPQEVRARLDACLAKLKAHRDARPLPRLDDKTIVAWNSMMIDAFAFAGKTLKEPAFLDAAADAANFILNTMRGSDGRMFRVARNGIIEQPAFLEDYAFLIAGLLSLHDATGQQPWLDRAVDVYAVADELFWDEAEDGGGYFFAPPSQHLIARSRSIDDGAIPSGNSAMLHNLVTLGQLTGEQRWTSRANAMLAAFGRALIEQPAAHVHMIHALERMLVQGSAQQIPVLERQDTLQQHCATHEMARITVRPDRERVRPGETFSIQVEFGMPPPWHINANPASSPELVPTLVDLRGDAPFDLVSVRYPDSRTLQPIGVKHPIQVFEGQFVITLTVRARDEIQTASHATIQVFLQYQPCTDERCLAPVESITDVSIQIVQ